MAQVLISERSPNRRAEPAHYTSLEPSGTPSRGEAHSRQSAAGTEVISGFCSWARGLAVFSELGDVRAEQSAGAPTGWPVWTLCTDVRREMRSTGQSTSRAPGAGLGPELNPARRQRQHAGWVPLAATAGLALEGPVPYTEVSTRVHLLEPSNSPSRGPRAFTSERMGQS